MDNACPVCIEMDNWPDEMKLCPVHQIRPTENSHIIGLFVKGDENQPVKEIMTKERAEALERLATICMESYLNTYEDYHGVDYYTCCNNKVANGHKGDCWYDQMQEVLKNLPA